ncbi:LacI family DNA-binding transcriptional regulator [Gallalistipes aquisgranensis]|uniref:LacI family DNA-binding transcriptional regulator n=1 Tax=Gallalistipes aquisgranensis TaxID=2779358 RepID=UPI001CF8850E|nr:LacI family DNA-binding transcriptional regulator [Gallalistipes aquisgranensis]MBE5034132.1 LacI family DNA-binding transcriptional regulator [Gallalistipes aquisgranensis]
MQTRRVTIKDIAEAVGVSTSLVSFVMNNKGKRYRVSEEMTRRIQEAARELNYQPNSAARSLRSGRSRTIGVIVSDISNPFFADIARRIEDNAYKYNYTVIFGSSDENAAKLENLIDVLVNKGVDGLIIVPCHGSEEVVRRVAGTSLPVVLLDRYIPDSDISHVVLNNRKATSLAVEHLIGQGYRRIEMVSYDMRLSNTREREEGYISTMERHGLGEFVRTHRVKFQRIPEQIREVIREMTLHEPAAEAVIFATNTLAVEGLKALAGFGTVVPRDIAVVGFDGSEAFELYYTTLTYIKQPIDQFGHEAVELLIRSIEERDRSRVAAVTLNPELVEGDSSRHRQSAAETAGVL